MAAVREDRIFVKRFPAVVLRGLSALALAAILAVCLRAQGADSAPPPAKPQDPGPVLVELFTSEGCPHCPEADAMLEKMYTEQSVEGAQIIALEEHVDYWDRQAWVDHFSSHAFTARQQNYADAMDLDALYTPEMVVDGLVEFVGNNAGRARATISALGRAPLAVIHFLPSGSSPANSPPSAMRVRLQASAVSRDSAADLFLVVAEDKLFSRVAGGSNAGESWPHSSVARSLRLAGKLPAGRGELSLTAEVAAPEPGWRVDHLRLVAFLQEEDSLRVLALGSAPFSAFLPDAAGATRPAARRSGPDASPAVSNSRRGSSN
ncbi:MAG TPA: DUF1223 domain-containing protein [Candidatus Acidoferrales bacterium]|nr:DUF1223 domain-containing protein [Candidatus Acidoferrales bacterium]